MYKQGQHYFICDVCGMRFHSEKKRRRWDGLMVCPDDNEVDHPQKYIRVEPDGQAVPDPRPETDEFVTVTYVGYSSTVPSGTFNNDIEEIVVPPPEETVVVYEDTFTGTGTLAAHTADTGQTYDLVSYFDPANMTLSGSGEVSCSTDWGGLPTPTFVPGAACRLTIVFRLASGNPNSYFNLRDSYSTYIEADATTIYVGSQNVSYSFSRDIVPHTLVIELDGAGTRTLTLDGILQDTAAATDSAPTDTFKFYGQFVGFVFNSIKLENL